MKMTRLCPNCGGRAIFAGMYNKSGFDPRMARFNCPDCNYNIWSPLTSHEFKVIKDALDKIYREAVSDKERNKANAKSNKRSVAPPSGAGNRQH